ncbi:MAG: helix-turn-helix domain-containing protein [Faecalibacillus sp.]
MRNYRLVVRKHELVDYQQREFFAVSHNFYDHDKIYKMHWHNSIEITYVARGEKIQIFKTKQGEKRIVADKGTLLLVNSGISHEIIVNEGLEGIVLLIDKSVLPYFYPNCSDVNFHLELNLEAKNQIIQNMLDLAKAKDENNKIKQHICTLNIISLLVEKLIDKDDTYHEKHDEINELITSITEYIDYNYARHITLDEIALMTHYNKSYLSSMFKKKIGITIFEYIKNVRLQHCLHDLKETDDTIVNIALSNGFANIQTFNKLFKQTYHMTPAQYRKNK